MSKIRNKTYHNFLIIRNKLMREKGYTVAEATNLSHLIFENVFYDKGHGDRPAEFFYDLVVSAEEYRSQEV